VQLGVRPTGPADGRTPFEVVHRADERRFEVPVVLVCHWPMVTTPIELARLLAAAGAEA
jgi:hypothetical protein